VRIYAQAACGFLSKLSSRRSTKTPLNRIRNNRERVHYWILATKAPKWGSCRLSDVKAIAVEKWLNDMPLAPGIKAKTKGVMSALFQHALRYEWATSNPIRLVRQSAVPVQEEIVLDSSEVVALLSELREPVRTIIFTAAVTGLRRGELFGLKWEDINF